MALLWKIRVDPGGGHFIASFFRLLVFYLTVRASRHFFFCFVCKKITKHTKRNDRSWLFFCGHAWNITIFLCMTRSIIFVCCRIIQNNTVEFNVCLNYDCYCLEYVVWIFFFVDTQGVKLVNLKCFLFFDLGSMDFKNRVFEVV